MHCVFWYINIFISTVWFFIWLTIVPRTQHVTLQWLVLLKCRNVFPAGIITAYAIQSAHIWSPQHSVYRSPAYIENLRWGGTHWVIWRRWGTAFPCTLLHFNHCLFHQSFPEILLWRFACRLCFRGISNHTCCFSRVKNSDLILFDMIRPLSSDCDDCRKLVTYCGNYILDAVVRVTTTLLEFLETWKCQRIRLRSVKSWGKRP